MKLLIAILVVFTAVAVFTDTRAKAGEWNEKPVMCGEETEVFGLMGSKDEQLLMNIINSLDYGSIPAPGTITELNIVTL